ncbi:MAG TPA: fasciclin domain-containing protein [Flavipsychrobacter sp.]|nr:fasciclin domain-containing protein [Flavipsychrobacter sp.]
MSNVADIVEADRNLTTMSAGLKASGLNVTLSKKGPFTVFAPNEIAFGKLDGMMMRGLLKPESKEKLTELISQHIVFGLEESGELKDKQKLRTLNGRELTVTITDGKTKVNGAVLQGNNNTGQNGTVYSMDKVIQFK